jgi:hypothetical protein
MSSATDIRGHVDLGFINVSGKNAVLMGLFFSPAAVQLASPDSGLLTAGVATNGNFQFTINGQVGQRFAIQASSDMIHWEQIDDITLQAGSLQFAVPDAPTFRTRFYRAVPTVGP